MLLLSQGGESMGKYEELKNLPADQFRRLTGVKPKTFSEMVNVLVSVQNNRYRKAGRRGKLTIEDKLLMTLEYLREYRTFFHLGLSYGLSESACCRACKKVEETLIKSQKFSLPGKKALLRSDTEYEVILVDASETPVERPKKKFAKRKK